jgi:hypothetical protein
MAWTSALRRRVASGPSVSDADVPYYRVDDFVPRAVADGMLATLIRKRDGFRRRGRQEEGGGTFFRLAAPFAADPVFWRNLYAVLMDVERTLALDLNEPDVELCAQAYNDGSAFGLHADATAGGPNWQRRVSGLYYLHGTPKTFSGGDLAIYDGNGRRHLVPPDHNSIVFFPRTSPHEVLPVVCPSQQFEDSRFALNIWVS